MNENKMKVQELISRLLNILNESDYEISGDETAALGRKAEMVDIYQTKMDLRNYSVTARSFSGEVLPWIHAVTVARPQFIDFPPVYVDGRLCCVRPVILLPNDESVESMKNAVHELCHLLANRPYIKNPDGSIFHQSGLLTFVYSMEEGSIHKIGIYGNAEVNELLNDSISVYLLEKIYDLSFTPEKYVQDFKNEILDVCRETELGSFERLIGYYFTGRTEEVKRWLAHLKTPGFGMKCCIDQ